MRRVYYLAAFIISFFIFRSKAEELDVYLASKGLVNVSLQDTTLRADFIYATPDNFIGKVLYSGISQVWLHPIAADMLITAQKLLKKEHPRWHLLVYDAARPMSVQCKMWALVRGTNLVNYVGNPANGGGLHNYGMAVDVTIADDTGKPLPMGTPFDFFGKEAHTTDEEALLASGRITRTEFDNRRLLRRIMRQAGFRVIPYEWWHFNACSRTEAIQNYPLID